MAEANLIIGTSGHIDHGKTSLIRSLTGVELDSAPEEQARGITISLGFTSLSLPDGRQVSFVDVPGHERLVRTMVAGVTGIDGVLLCVSAVEGVMPQTREHFEILSLLGVKSGIVVVTKVDLVDEELLELAVDDVNQLTSGTSLEGSPVVLYSSVTGQGKEQLLSALAGLAKLDRPKDGPFRLPVDRVFTRDGFGTVVTGTVSSGSARAGQDVIIQPSGDKSRIRGMEVHGQEQAAAVAGSRAALNLAGLDRDQLQRGLVITAGEVPCASMVDVYLCMLPSAPELKDGVQLRVLLGTAERIAKAFIAEDTDEFRPGQEVYVQLRLDSPMVCLPGDPFIIRRVSPLETLGGGVVVDPWAMRMRRKNREEYGTQIARLMDGDHEVWLERAGEEGLPETEWRQRVAKSDVGFLVGGRRFSQKIIARLEGFLLEALAQFHTENPLSLGAHRRELRRDRLAHLTDKVFDSLLERLANLDAVSLEGPLVCVSGYNVALTAEQRDLYQMLLSSVVASKWDGVSVGGLHKQFPQAEVTALMKLIESSGQIHLVSDVGWVSVANTAALQSLLQGWFSDNEEITPSDFKELTSLTRKRAIPFLEWSDQQRWTRRRGNLRMQGDKLFSR